MPITQRDPEELNSTNLTIHYDVKPKIIKDTNLKHRIVQRHRRGRSHWRRRRCRRIADSRRRHRRRIHRRHRQTRRVRIVGRKRVEKDDDELDEDEAAKGGRRVLGEFEQ